MCHGFPPSCMLMHITSNPLLAFFFRCVIERVAWFVVSVSRAYCIHLLPRPLCAFFSSLSKGPYKCSLSPHRKSSLWLRVFFPSRIIFFPERKVIHDDSVVELWFFFFFFCASNRSLDGGARC